MVKSVNKVYKYRLGVAIILTSTLYLVGFAALGTLPFVLGYGDYVAAWSISLLLAILALMLLSMPRKVVLAEDGVEIHCVSDYSFIEYGDIDSIGRRRLKEMPLLIPIFGVVGFFGHYGRFLDLRRWEVVHVYASKWSDFVEITDINNGRYYISCDNADDIIEQIERTIQSNNISERE